MAAINIEQLTEAEPIDLNHRIVERLRLLQHMRAHVDMLESESVSGSGSNPTAAGR